MKTSFYLAAGGLAVLLASAASAKPEDYRYDRCSKRYAFGLEARHKKAHQQAHAKDQLNHDNNDGQKKNIAGVHSRLNAFLAREHSALAATQRDLARKRRPAPRASYVPPRKQDPPRAAPTPRHDPPSPRRAAPAHRPGPPSRTYSAPRPDLPPLVSDKPGRRVGEDDHPGRHLGQKKDDDRRDDDKKRGRSDDKDEGKRKGKK
jgi:hypothetical protein